MRHISRTTPPSDLTEEKKAELTHKYITNKQEHVWDQQYLRSALTLMSHDKCAYCEARLDEKSMYMEVEHFFPKSRYPHLVVEWDNLLPSCKHCNASKGNHDPGQEPIIDPTSHTPSDHLQLYNYRFVGRDKLGGVSVDVLDLNDYRNTLPRFRIGTKVLEVIDQVPSTLAEYERDHKAASRNRALRSVRRILLECSASSEYSVVVATIVVESFTFASVRAQMQRVDLWCEEFEQEYRQASKVACAKYNTGNVESNDQ